jgi:hypothetical protein
MSKSRDPNQNKSEILQGTLDLTVLQTLHALGPLHGYGSRGGRADERKGAAAQRGHRLFSTALAATTKVDFVGVGGIGE